MDFQLDYRNVLVIGLGYRTGLAAANFLASRGSCVTVSDIKKEDELKEIISKLHPGVIVLAGKQDPEILKENFSLAVLSPGVPAAIPLVSEARRKGVPVISEIELAYGFLKGNIIAITGTDGKSTTTSLLGHILSDLGVDNFVGGNIGIPLISLVEKTTDRSVSVIELSSFQLETVTRFKPDVAAILNISPDHLDRYRDMHDYFQAKMKISRTQTVEDHFIYNSDDDMICAGMDQVSARSLRFSLHDDSADSFYKNGWIYVYENNESIPVIETQKLSLLGVHNIQNVMASLLCVVALYKKKNLVLDYEKTAAAIITFKGLPHRMEIIGNYRGRTFVNDSKATTIGAVSMALRGLSKKEVLIMGGRTKGDDYSRLKELVREKVKQLILIGESTQKFSGIFQDIPQYEAKSMEDAVTASMKLSNEGDMVLLSPACTSFDMFKSFEDRGDTFKKAFEKLSRGEISWT